MNECSDDATNATRLSTATGHYLYFSGLEGADWEELISTWAEVAGAMEHHLWALGEIAASVERKYGTRAIGMFASEVGYSPRRVYELAQTYITWRTLRPSQLLSHRHHSIAARDPEPQILVDQAEDERLSSGELAERVKQRRGQCEQAEHGPAQLMLTITCPHCDGSGRMPVDGDASEE